ncbi:MAG: (d)CMP kinase, partial [Caldilineaceae bacterium]|nr:(d)CMP kinase [Caldilineaceae bacterium]
MQTRTTPFVVAIDGASGAGKSTLAPLLAADLAAVLIPTDDFFSAHIPDADWDRFTVAERYAQVLDWARIRSD